MKKKLWIVLLCAMALGMTMLLAGCGSGSGGDDTESTEATEEAVTVTDPVKVTCENGVMLGQTADGVTSFKGVPYAQAKRFHKPEKPAAWDGIRDCTSFGYVCPLVEMPGGFASEARARAEAQRAAVVALRAALPRA